MALVSVGNTNGFSASHLNAVISELSDAFPLPNMSLNFLLVSGNDARRCSGMEVGLGHSPPCLVSISLIFPLGVRITKLWNPLFPCTLPPKVVVS